jgi:hypothetical protein
MRMKKSLFAILMAWISFQTTAQITVPASTFPSAGDVLRFVQAANPSLAIALYTPPGGGQIWDLSMLTSTSNFDRTYLPAAEGIYQDRFPTATMVVKTGTNEDYYTSSATKFIHLGQAATTVGGLPLLAIYENTPSLPERHAPLNFFDIYQSSSNNLLPWSFAEIPTGGVNLPVTPDSIRFRISTQVLEVVDAWGTLIVPGSSSGFPVLRLKRTRYKEARVDAKVPPLGWLDVTDNVIQGGTAFSPLFGVDTVLTHHFYNDISKEEIAILTFNTAQNAVTSATYKNIVPPSSVHNIGQIVVPTLHIYPNPASSAVTVRCNNAVSGMYSLKIFNSLGVLIAADRQFLTENGLFSTALPEGLDGLYYSCLEDAMGRMVGMGRILLIQ